MVMSHWPFSIFVATSALHTRRAANLPSDRSFLIELVDVPRISFLPRDVVLHVLDGMACMNIA